MTPLLWGEFAGRCFSNNRGDCDTMRCSNFIGKAKRKLWRFWGADPLL
jgi:hypothetical protein